MKKASPPAAATRARTRPVPEDARRWRGALEGIHDGHLIGWAFDSARPDARVVLELCLDGTPIAGAVADIARSDLFDRMDGAADPCHGFVADLRALDVGQSGTVTARIANTDAALDGAVSLARPQTPPAAAASQVIGDGGLRIHGWALDPASPQRKVAVHAYVGHERVASTLATLEHAALRSHEIGAHGFTLDLPLTLADGRLRQVRVVDDQGQPLGGSPVQVCCLATGMRALLPAPQADAIADLVASYESYLPRSVGMGHYAGWSARFETPCAPGIASGLQVALLVWGPDGAALEATRAAILAQTHPLVAVFVAQGKGRRTESFHALLARALASGCDVVACLRAGDILAPHALACALEGFVEPGAELVYSDSERGGMPWFKPAWNPDYALASDYPLDLMLARAAGVRALLDGGAQPAAPAELGWQLLVQSWPRGERAIVHVPRVLCRCEAPLDAAELALRDTAAAAALAQLEPAAVLDTHDAHAALPGLARARRVRRPLSPEERQLGVSLLIPTRDHAGLLQRCIESIQRHSADWPRLEIVVIDNGSVEKATLAYFRKLDKQGVRVLSMPGPFNFATLNNAAAAAASGEILGLVNNDIEALHDGWLDELVGQLLRPGVGAAGAKLLWPNGMVQHGGVLLGMGGLAGHFGNRLLDADPGDHGRNQLAQQVSAVTAACLLVRKHDYLALGGMDERAFPVAFNDVDLCLKLRAAGKLITWTPYARLLHAESASRGKEDTPQKRARAGREADLLRRRWGPALLRDPAYHPSLNLDVLSQAFGGLALPPRERSPRTAALARPNEEQE